ncbi:hypothetical protein [Modestobacter sp. URMC 112]
MRRVAVLSACVVAGSLLCPSSALAAEDDSGGVDHRWIAVEDEFAIVLPDGQTFTEDTPPPEGEEPESFPVGAQLFISEALYATEDGETAGDAVGRTHVVCTAGVVADNLLCDIVWVFDEGGQLHGTVHVDFSAVPETEQLSFDIAVTGGTGDWSGASGTVTLTDTSDAEDPEGETTTLYEAHLE